MKKELMAVAAALIIAASLCACGSVPDSAQTVSSPSPSATDAPGPYKDGTYEYVGKRDSEVYHVEGTMVVSNGNIQSMEWKIVDENKNRVFDETYEEVFTGNQFYIQQCRDNWSGMQGYVPALLETQDPDKVDAVTGATWAYDKFEEAAKAMLEQAKK